MIFWWKMDKQVEYSLLKEEIFKSMQMIKDYRNWMYTIVIAVLILAFDKDEAILFLVPFGAIIPMYILSIYESHTMMRIGAYIYVFIEPGTDCQWDTRLLKYDNIPENRFDFSKFRIDSYMLLSFFCLTFSIMKLDYSYIDYKFCFTVVIQIIIFFICIYLFEFKRPNYIKIKKMYIDKWELIHRQEIG